MLPHPGHSAACGAQGERAVANAVHILAEDTEGLARPKWYLHEARLRRRWEIFGAFAILARICRKYAQMSTRLYDMLRWSM